MYAPPTQLDLLSLAVILASGEPHEASRSHHPARRCSRVAAKPLGLDVPAKVIALADEVIE